jgi:hypothetical protein
MLICIYFLLRDTFSTLWQHLMMSEGWKKRSLFFWWFYGFEHFLFICLIRQIWVWPLCPPNPHRIPIATMFKLCMAFLSSQELFQNRFHCSFHPKFSCLGPICVGPVKIRSNFFLLPYVTNHVIKRPLLPSLSQLNLTRLCSCTLTSLWKTPYAEPLWK